MNENINLCEILKEHEGEIFWSPLFGELIFTEVKTDYDYPIKFTLGDIPYYFTSDGKFNKGNVECLLFPSKDQRDWNKWIDEQKSKASKTWSELEDSKKSYILTKNLSKYNPIEKSALALLKIHQLIDYSYGGIVTNEERRDNSVSKYYIDCNYLNGKLVIVNNKVFRKHIAFHTKEQAEEFLSYPENIQLLKDYFMI